MSTESGLRQRIRAAIRAYDPAVLIVGQPANGMTGPGRHDLYAVVRGVYVGLEVKTSTGRATQVQLDRITITRRAGGWAWLVRTTAGAVWAIKAARRGPPQKGHMADDFDIDKLLAGLRSGPDKEERQDAVPELEELPDFTLPPTLTEEHIAAAAQANGTAAGDGEALGEVPAPTEMLARAIDNLAEAVRYLSKEVQTLKAAREAQTALDKEYMPAPKALEAPEAEPMSPDLAAMLIPPEEPAETPPPTRKRRGK